jgi:hypothetical protein
VCVWGGEDVSAHHWCAPLLDERTRTRCSPTCRRSRAASSPVSQPSPAPYEKRQQGRRGVRAVSTALPPTRRGRCTHRPPPPRLRRRHPCILVNCATTLLRLRRREAAQQLGRVAPAPPWACRTRSPGAAESCSHRCGGVMAQPRMVACPQTSSPRRSSLPTTLPRLWLPAEGSAHGATRPHRCRRLPVVHSPLRRSSARAEALRWPLMTWLPQSSSCPRSDPFSQDEEIEMAAMTQTLAFAPLSATRVSRRSASAFVGGACSLCPGAALVPPAGVRAALM